MIRWIAYRIALTGVVVWFLGTVVFTLLHILPGDPVILMLGEYAHPADVVTVRRSMGLDRPLMEQYGRFWWNLVRGEWGTSFLSRQSIRAMVLERLKNSAILALTAVALTVLISLPLGGWAAVCRRADAWITPLTTLGVAMPSFVIAPLLMYLFSVQLGWLPVSGMGTWKHLVLPTLTLSVGLTAYLTRITRSSVREVLRQPFVQMAHAKGIPRRWIVVRHVLRPSAVPIVTVIGLQTGALLTGTVITETIFAWPGLGRLFVQSIYARDYPVVQVCVLVFGVVYAGVNAIVDILYVWLDPRTRPVQGIRR